MIDIEAGLRAENPKAKTIDLQIFADALRTYREASKNVLREGAIVLHPRTGAPMDNPFLKIQSQKGAILVKMKMIRSDKLMELLKNEQPNENP